MIFRGQSSDKGVLLGMRKSLCVWFALGLPAAALIFRDGVSPAANTETAPTGAFADSGWQYQIRYSAFHGTMISPKHFITATHLGANQTVITQPVIFNGVEERSYTIKPGSRRIINGSDLSVFEIWETFDLYAPLYTTVDEPGREMVICGRGFGRGIEIAGQGWRWGGTATRLSRWGRNIIDGGVTSGGNDLLFFTFNDLLGQDEAAATGGDSGGGWFVKDGPTWKLAGVSFSVDGNYSEDAVPTNANGFRGSFYDAGGLSIGSDASGWNLIPTTGFSTNPGSVRFARQSHTYGSRISSHIPEINALINPALALADSTPTERFGNWLTVAGVTTLTAPGDDADGDGVTNLEEYLTESDPSDGEEAVSPLEIVFPEDGTHQFTLVESLDLAGRGLATTLESSVNLTTWATVNDAIEGSTTVDNGEGVRMRILTRIPGPNETGALYYRLKINLP